MRYLSTRRRLCQQAVVLLSSFLLLGAWSLPAWAQTARVPSFKRIHTDLCNFDLRVPQIPTGVPVNDLVIIIYGIFPGGVGDVVSTFQNPLWGLPKVEYVPGWRGNPLHAGFGFDQLIIRYGWRDDNTGVEPARPGSPMHFGIHLRPCRLHVHVEAWWTHNGQRVARAWLCHIYKVRVPGAWLVRVSNPRALDGTDKPLIAHGAQFFTPGQGVPSPRLEELMSDIEPTKYGADGWKILQDGDHYPSMLELEPDMVATFMIPNPDEDPTPPVFQIKLEELGQGPGGAAAADQVPPLAVVTDRAAVELEADTNGDGAVGLPDFNTLRSQFGKSSPDEVP